MVWAIRGSQTFSVKAKQEILKASVFNKRKYKRPNGLCCNYSILLLVGKQLINNKKMMSMALSQ